MMLIYILDIRETRNFLSFFFFTTKGITLDKELLLSSFVPDDHTIGSGPNCCTNGKWDILLARASSSAKVIIGGLISCADLGPYP